MEQGSNWDRDYYREVLRGWQREVDRYRLKTALMAQTLARERARAAGLPLEPAPRSELELPERPLAQQYPSP